ncbi:hypothetical protein [Nonomuraea gerenzanensis]|nr:hypothetical protein [Nonomuraea gerenzanensis]UBU19159.1 hypothetical protein LCN96_45805 [Nonomuraea gerenzanensis]
MLRVQAVAVGPAEREFGVRPRPAHGRPFLYLLLPMGRGVITSVDSGPPVVQRDDALGEAGRVVQLVQNCHDGRVARLAQAAREFEGI